MSNNDTTHLPQTKARLLVNQHGLISGVRFTSNTPDVVFGEPEVVRIKPSGEVVIAEGANLDDAARAFWNAITEWRGDGSRPTLADAQPGGRVRLGNQAERARFEAWAHAQSYRGGNIMADRDAVHPDMYADPVAQLTWKSWQAALSAQPSPVHQIDAETLWWLQDAINTMVEGGNQSHVRFLQSLHDLLSAQPSPGGQDALKALDDLAAFCSDDTETVDRHVAVIRAALASRQPVGEPIGFQFRSRQWSDEEFAGPWLNPNVPNRAHYDSRPANYETRSIYAAPPAQAVDLEQFRQPVQDWLDDAQASMEEHGDYDGVFGHVIEEGTRLLALIDSQAVGNG